MIPISSKAFLIIAWAVRRSDLEKARKLIKQIGLELHQDPEFGPNIIEPLKIQGVDELGDYAVMIRAKIVTVPGEQFESRPCWAIWPFAGPFALTVVSA